MIIDLQRRLAEAGRIRIGHQTATSNGRKRPEKLDTFRLTSPDRARIEQAAHLFGGTPQQWDAPAGTQWEVITTTDALHVIVPPADMSFSQYYELWSGGGCQRRCDGRYNSITDSPCMCDPDKRECSIHTRLSVMLRDLPGLGVWRIDTSGYYAAVELQGAVEVVQLAAGRGQMLPARLRLEQRMVKRVGQGTRRFAVPVLDIEVSPGQLLGPAPLSPMLDGPTPAAVEAVGEPQSNPRPALTPVPDTVPEAPVPSIADQASPEPEPRRRRANSAPPVPPSGLKPRTVNEIPPPEDTPAAPQPEPEIEVIEPVELITSQQLKKLSILLREAGFDTQHARHDFVASAIERQIGSAKELTKDEASKVIDILDSGKQ